VSSLPGEDNATAAGTPGPRPAKRGYLLPGVIALTVLGLLALVGGYLTLQPHLPDTLDGPVVARFLSEDLQQGRNAPEVTCPSTEPVRRGLVFYCRLLRPGHPDVRLKVTETGHAGFALTPPARR